MLGLLATVQFAPAQMTTNIILSPNAGIPDGSAVGLVEHFLVGGLSGVITNIQVTLDITGGFNGDLYAYLAGPQGQLAVLLNRSGITGANAFGYGDAGFNLTLGLSGANVHGYGSGYSVNGSGQVVGAWGADGRNIDPQSAGSVFDGAGTGANLNLFQNTDANGTWTLFIADLGAGGGTANLNSATLSLTLMAVPEPQPWVMFFGGMTTLWMLCRNRTL